MQQQINFDEPTTPTTGPLSRQKQAIVAVTKHGQWMTLEQILRGVRGMGVMVQETGLSMRIRELRNRHGFTVDVRPIAKGAHLHQYRITKP